MPKPTSAPDFAKATERLRAAAELLERLTGIGAAMPGTESATGEDEPKVYQYETDAEARAAFLADNREVIENEAVAMVVLARGADGELRARVLSTHGACAYTQGSVLIDVAEEIGRTHNVAACAQRRAESGARN